MRVALLILANDLRQRLRDRSVWIMAVAAPLALASVFAMVLPDLDGGIDPPTWAVVDEDGGELAGVFVDVAMPIVARDLDATVTLVADREEAALGVDDGTYDAAFVLPLGLGVDGTPVVEVLAVEGRPVQTIVAESVARSFAHGAEQIGVALAAAEALDARPAELARLPGVAFVTPLPAELVEVDADDRVLDLTTFLAAGMGVMFLFFAVPFGVTSLLEERSRGTLGRMLVAPISPWTIIGGKILTSLAIGLGSMFTLVVASSLLLGADWGPPAGVAVLVLAGVAAAVSLVGVVAAVAKTAEQASVAQAILAIVLAMFGGVFFPVSDGPGLLRLLSLATPHAWFLRGLGDLSADTASITAVLPAVGALLVFAAVGAALTAVLGLRRSLTA